MPMMGVVFSAPLSFLFGIIGSIILHAKGKSLLNTETESDDSLHRVALAEFLQSAHRHLRFCFLVTLIVGALLFTRGMGLVYSFKPIYLISGLLYSFGPFFAWVISTRLLAQLIYEYGSRPSNLVYAGITHIVLVIALFSLANLFV